MKSRFLLADVNIADKYGCDEDLVGRALSCLRKRIVQLDLAMLLAGTKYRGEFEDSSADFYGLVTNSGGS